jgi:hypothetical protein
MPIHWRGVWVLLADIIAAFVEDPRAGARPGPPVNDHDDPDAHLRDEVIALIRDLERHPDVQHDPQAPEDVDDILAMDHLQLLQLQVMLLQLRAELDEPPPAHLINGADGRRIGTLREFIDQHYQAHHDAIARAGVAQRAQNAQNPQNVPQAVNLNIDGYNVQRVHMGNVGPHEMLDLQAALDENEPINLNINGRNIQALPIGPIQDNIGQHTVQAVEAALHDLDQPAANAQPNNVNIPELIRHLSTVEQLRIQQYQELRAREMARLTTNPGIREDNPQEQRIRDNNFNTLRMQLRDIRAQLHILRQVYDGAVDIEQRRHDATLALIRNYALQTVPPAAPQRRPHPLFAPRNHTPNVLTLEGFDADALEDEDDRRCPICLAQFENGDVVWHLPCAELGHRVHNDCIREWWRRGQFNCIRCTRPLTWRMDTAD